MTEENQGKRKGVSRRQVLSISAAASLAAAGANVVRPASARAQAAPEPVVEIARLADLSPGDQIYFDYPDEESPAVLLNLTEPAQDGIGPNRSIVAFSLLCTHKGCPLSWNAENGILVCPCHWSSFDPGKKGRMIIGQASQSLPQITLALEQGVIRAVGVAGLIYGRQTNVL